MSNYVSVTPEIALEIWIQAHGNVEFATDPYGTYMHRDDYGVNKGEGSRVRDPKLGKKWYGWDIDHIKASANEGEDHKNNYEPTQIKNNRELKSDNDKFTISDVEYQIVECSICKRNNVYGYGIVKTSTNTRVDWKGKKNRYYPN